jgi:hypothetical protein
MDELAAWLLDQIEITTDMERLKRIGEAIAADADSKAAYLSDPKVLAILRRAWGEKRDELLDSATRNDNITDVVAKTATTNDSSGQPA